MSTHRRLQTHPDLERYYDAATDRAVVGVHVATCRDCTAWLADIDERLRRLPCIQLVELVTDYLEETLDSDLRAQVDDHLRLCEGCRSYLDQVRTTIATIGRIPEAGDPSQPVQAGLLAVFRAWRGAGRSTEGGD